MDAIAHGTVKRGRFYDATVGRWFKDGFAPSQLPEFLLMDCGRCGGRETLTAYRTGVSICRECSRWPS